MQAALKGKCLCILPAKLRQTLLFTPRGSSEQFSVSCIYTVRGNQSNRNDQSQQMQMTVSQKRVHVVCLLAWENMSRVLRAGKMQRVKKQKGAKNEQKRENASINCEFLLIS